MNILGLGLPELIVIALILLLFFGPKRLPGLFRSFGHSVRELKKGLGEDEKDALDTESETPTKKAETSEKETNTSATQTTDNTKLQN